MSGNKVVCPNCGAAIYESEANCPFCGYINIPGAEEKFMRDIQKTERDMSHIPELQKEEYKKTISKSSKVIFITIGITVLIAAILFGVYMLMEKLFDSAYEPDAKAQMIWNNQNYPILDEMYEAKDYDGIIQFEYDMFDGNAKNGTEYHMYDWEHYNFISGYKYFMHVEEVIECLDKGKELSKYQKENLVYYCMWFYHRQYDYSKEYMPYTDEEIATLDGYREITNGYMFGRLGFTQEEVDKLYAEAVDEYHILDNDTCWDYGRKVGDRFK